MPYIVNNTDSTVPITVADGVVDTSTYSLALVGRNVSNYGQYFAQNTIRQLENFASVTAPSPSVKLTGQIWYDKTEEVLRVWDGTVWKRATGVIIGNASERPTTALTGGSTSFFNTTVNKLEVHDGSSWRESSYAGEVTSAYSTSSTDNNPTFYGSRIHNIFLTDTTGRKQPVLALSYVKSTSDSSPSANKGTTLINGQFETIMALFSDSEFTIDANVSAIVDGTPVSNLYTELTASGEGIASDRSGRAAGKILPGMNIRAEYETSGVIEASTIFADNIGSVSQPVGNLFVDAVTINDGLTVANATVDIGGDLDVDGTVTIGGDISASTGLATFANLVVSENTTLNNNTVINGNLTVNGVSTQTLGNATQVIEDYYGDNINTANIEVSALANVLTANVVSLNVSGNTSLNGSLDVAGLTTVQNIDVSGALDVATTLDVGGISTFVANIAGSSATFTGNITASNFLGDLTGNVTGDLTGDVTGNVTGNLTGDVTGDLTGNIIGDVNVSGTSTFTGDVTTGANLSVVGNFAVTGTTTMDDDLDATGSNVSADYFVGTATQAQYADLAEIYASDADYTPGTVVKLGGTEEITATTQSADTEVFGVISTDPAYLMNSKANGLPVALQGRVPVQVVGEVKKGERLISSDTPGVAKALGDTPYDPRIVIGRSLQDGGNGIVEAVIGVK